MLLSQWFPPFYTFSIEKYHAIFYNFPLFLLFSSTLGILLRCAALPQPQLLSPLSPPTLTKLLPQCGGGGGGGTGARKNRDSKQERREREPEIIEMAERNKIASYTVQHFATAKALTKRLKHGGFSHSSPLP